MSNDTNSTEKNEKATRQRPEDAERERRLEALQRFLSGPKFNISENGRMPTADERNARR